MFNKYPINSVKIKMNDHVLTEGYETIINHVVTAVKQSTAIVPVIAIDGTNGADFHTVIQQIIAVLEKSNYSIDVQSTTSYVKPGSQLREQFAENITENRAFGFITEAKVSEFFIADAQAAFAAHLQNKTFTNDKKICIVFGPGAYWLTGEKTDQLYFLDVSREYQQAEYKKDLRNFGMDWNKDGVEKYKISFFVEWPILENYRKSIFDRIGVYVDINQQKKPVSIPTAGLKAIVSDIVRRPLRVKPFFAPGIWGGQRLRELADLPQDWVNCAWSFEPIAPENSILIGFEEQVIEVPFLVVMALEHLNIMGERNVNLFGDYFPVRFDYLDTFDGSNLSCQVHPKQEYVTKHFNEKMTQQESYYIMEKKGDAKVYLGFTEGTKKEDFESAVTTAQESAVPLEFTNYVNEFESEKGDLFLIPPGTVHCSGTDNLVLEISSTTWWFTFKIYDYLRKDLDGKPRPLNIDHGFENIDYYKTTDWVKDNLITQPQLVNTQGNNEEYLLGQRDDLLFYVGRVHLQDEWKDNTNNEFVMYNLVEGEKVRIVSIEDESVFVELGYAESYILPSVFGEYKLVNVGNTSCKLLKAGVSPNWDVKLV